MSVAALHNKALHLTAIPLRSIAACELVVGDEITPPLNTANLPRPRRRGKILQFSPRAYFRFLAFVNALNLPTPRFITLTFPDELNVPDAKKVLHRYLKGLSGQWVWRLDFSERSGRPHFHLLYWGDETDHHLTMTWHNLNSLPGPYLVHISKGKGQKNTS